MPKVRSGVMLGVERRRSILDILRVQGIVTVSELSQKFSVTEETVRRDLNQLTSESDVSRTHGGAYITRAVHSDIPVGIREDLCLEGKDVIAELAQQLVENGETIFLDSSTTSVHIAERLKTRKDLIVITNGLKVVSTLAQSDSVKVICTGGVLRVRQLSFTGPAAVKSLQQYYADKAFVSCTGLDARRGLTDSDENEACVRKAMLDHAQKRIVIADHSKFGKTSFALISSIDSANFLITDEEPSASWEADLEARKIRYLFGMKANNT